MRSRLVVLAAALLTLAAPAAAEPVFEPLALPPGFVESEALGISPDGCTIVGRARSDAGGWRAVRWYDGAAKVIPPVQLGMTPRMLTDVSATGLMVGVALQPGGTSIWEERALYVGEVGVGAAIERPLHVYGAATAISPDGSAFVAWGATGHDGDVVDGFITGDGGLVDLGHLDPPPVIVGDGPTTLMIPKDVTDGRVVVGYYDGLDGFDVPIRWEDGTLEILPHAPAPRQTRAQAASADASIVVGYELEGQESWVVRWVGGEIERTGLVGAAFDVSADGAVMVGRGAGGRAFIGDAAEGWRPVEALLPGGAPSGWTLERATAITRDAEAIVGHGPGPGGNRRAWAVYRERAACPPLPSPPELPPRPRPTAVGRYEEPIQLFGPPGPHLFELLPGSSDLRINDVVFDPAGNAYLPDRTGEGAVRIEPSGQISQFFDLTGDGLWSPDLSQLILRAGRRSLFAARDETIWDLFAPGRPALVEAAGDALGNAFRGATDVLEAPDGVLSPTTGSSGCRPPGWSRSSPTWRRASSRWRTSSTGCASPTAGCSSPTASGTTWCASPRTAPSRS